MLAVAAVMLYRWFIRFHSGRAALPAAILFLVFVAVPSVNGMESSLLILLLVILAVLGWKMRIDAESGFLKNLLFGVVTGFVVLARLDMIFLPAVVCLLCLWPAVARGANRIPYFLKSLAIGAGTTMVVAPYLIRNHVKYGDIMPISRRFGPGLFQDCGHGAVGDGRTPFPSQCTFHEMGRFQVAFRSLFVRGCCCFV